MPSMLIDDDTRLLVLTGAGVSAESGVPTFRDSDGLWEKHPFERVASLDGFIEDPALVWRFYSQRRAGAKGVSPNRGHTALADVERRLGDRFLLVTQNVDGLHQRAGSQRVIELHGSLWKSRCSVCARPPFADDAVYGPERLPGCKVCEARGAFALLRPHIVWFGELLNPADLEAVASFLLEARGHRLVFLAVGTSGVVFPAADLVRQARALGAETWLVNAEPSANATAFEHLVLGKSGEQLPGLLGS